MTPATPSRSDSTHEGEPPRHLLASGALFLAWIPFLVGGLLVIQTDTPPSLSPTLGLLSHALWALATVFLATGTLALLRSVGALRRGLAGYASAATFGLAVLHGLQWTTWAYVDVRAARTAEHDLVVETLIVPFGAGHLLTYCIVLGGAIALLGWALRRSTLTHRFLDLAGVALGALTVVAASVSLVSGFGGGSDGHTLFDFATLLLPVLYLWAGAVGVSVYRNR